MTAVSIIVTTWVCSCKIVISVIACTIVICSKTVLSPTGPGINFKGSNRSNNCVINNYNALHFSVEISLIHMHLY